MFKMQSNMCKMHISKNKHPKYCPDSRGSRESHMYYRHKATKKKKKKKKKKTKPVYGHDRPKLSVLADFFFKFYQYLLKSAIF